MSHFTFKIEKNNTKTPNPSWGVILQIILHSLWHSLSFLFIIFTRALRWRSGSAQPWRCRGPGPGCRPQIGSGPAESTDRPRCGPHGHRWKPESEGGPQSARVPSWSRWPPGRGRAGCSPCRLNELCGHKSTRVFTVLQRSESTRLQ